MLTALSIRDIVLIEKLDISLEEGLTVLTGETGAGKSILLDALGLALGGRLVGTGFQLFEPRIIELGDGITFSRSIATWAHGAPGQAHAGRGRRGGIIAENIFDHVRGRTPREQQGNSSKAQ